jgi:hypothetical protein
MTGMLGASLLASQRRKDMKTKDKARSSGLQRRRTLRLSDYEDARLANQAYAAGLSVSEYMRRRFFGGRPIVAHTDDRTIRELRRLGGLLKYNFETLRQAGANPELLQKQETLLTEISLTIDRIGGKA